MKKHRMNQFIGKLQFEYVNGVVYKLIAPFGYVAYNGETVNVPTGFRTDGASIPRFFWRLIGPPLRGPYARAAVIHDYLCSQFGYNRKRADEMFLEALHLCGVGRVKSVLMFVGVRIGAFFS